MKIIFSFVMLLFGLSGIYAQPDKLGIIEVYGTKNVAVADIRAAIGMREGDSLNRNTFSKSAIEKRILSVPGIVQADVSLVCCDDKQGRFMLYAGVGEESTLLFPYHDQPTGAYKLDDFIVQAYNRYENTWMDAVKAGKAIEDDEQGHVLLNYPPAQLLQDSFITYAATNLPLLRQVIWKSGMAEQRQIAAWIIAYVEDKKTVVDDLLYAASDPDETVRNNATRALGVMARFATEHPSSGIVIPALPFINMVHSIAWTDRNKGTMLLEALTKNRDSSLLQQLKNGALYQLEEMARWKNPGHAFFSMIILGRMAGIPDQDIFAAIGDENKEVLIDEWLRKITGR